MQTKEIYFIRHGETDYNRRGIVQGSGVDEPINEVGRAQAQAFFDHYESQDFDLIMVSKLQRTRQTVDNFIKKGIPMLEDVRLNEMSWGIHEGQSPSPEMKLDFRAMIDAWQQDDLTARLPEGESAEELYKRLNLFLVDLVTRPEQKILICTHGRTLRCLCCVFNKIHLREMEKFGHSNTGLFKVNWSAASNTFEMDLQNDTRHLKKM